MSRAISNLFAFWGFVVAVLWFLGAVGLGDFWLYFGPVDSIECTVERRGGNG